MLVEETLQTCAQYLNTNRREEYDEHRAKTLHSLVLRGKLLTAVRWITERETGGVIKPAERCTKTGDILMEFLRTKHPKARPPTSASMKSYPDCPLELISMDITGDTVTEVAGRLSGGAGPGGME